MTAMTMMKTLQYQQQNHFYVGGPLPLPVDRHRMMMIFAIFLLATSTTTTVVQAVPARMLSSGNNKIISTSSQSTVLNNGNSHPALFASNVPEEELELESLKGANDNGNDSPSKKSLTFAPGASTPVSSSSTSKPLAYVKKPENEETPALSDNANSLKYGGANADLEEALANMAHIPPSKQPTLSVRSGGGFGGTAGASGYPLGDSGNLQQQKRTRSASSFASGGVGGGGLGLLNRAGAAAAGVNLEVDYTPQDIAEYIFWMGDERGVELALSDFVQDGLITEQDAIRFLEEVKAELNLLKARYASTITLGRPSSSAARDGMDITNPHDERGFWEVPVRAVSKKHSYFSSNPSSSNSYFSGNSGYYSPSSSSSASSLELTNGPYYSSGPSSSSSMFRLYGNMYKDAAAAAGTPKSAATTSTNSVEDMLDYEEIIDKLRQADSKMREVVLEGIIYQLARELFSMGLQQSSGSSVPAFTKFIENLSVNGNISKDLERSVLETLVQALVDAANERGLLNAKLSSSSSSSAVENQLSSLSEKVSATESGTIKPIIVKKKSV